MKITPDDITSDPTRYRLIRSIDYSDIAGFVISHLKPSNPAIALLIIFSVASLALAVVLRIEIAPQYSVLQLLPFTLAGLILFPLLLIPVHEGVHIIIFMLLGGRNIRIGADLANYIVYVTAHRHVVGTRGFLAVAFSPFAVISATLIAAIAVLPPPWQWSLSLTLLAHTTMCAGDFAMAAFLWIHRGKRILTWDDADKKIAYFYADTQTETTI